jgi:hypothetical protein
MSAKMVVVASTRGARLGLGWAKPHIGNSHKAATQSQAQVRWPAARTMWDVNKLLEFLQT